MIERLEGEGLAPSTGAGAEAAAGEDPGGRLPGRGADGETGEGLPFAEESRVAADAADSPAGESLVRIEPGELRGALEAVLFSTPEPIPIRALSDLFAVSVHEVREAVEELRLEYIDTRRAFRIEDIAGGVQMLTLPAHDPWIRKLRQKEREGRLSPAALETLAVIAYKQPIHKADLEGIRGVGCGPILKTLMDRGLVQITGRGEGLGKPLLYGTTRRFLESFGIASIRDLPQPDLSERPGPPEPEASPRVSAALTPPPSPADAPPAEPAESPPVEGSIITPGGPLS